MFCPFGHRVTHLKRTINFLVPYPKFKIQLRHLKRENHLNVIQNPKVRILKFNFGPVSLCILKYISGSRLREPTFSEIFLGIFKVASYLSKNRTDGAKKVETLRTP